MRRIISVRGVLAGAAATLLLLVAGTAGAIDRSDFERGAREGYKLVDEEVTLPQGVGVEVDLGDVDVWIKKGSGRTVKVEAWVRAGDEERAREYFDERIRMKVKTSESSVRVSSRTSSPNWGWRHSRRGHAWAIITVPDRVDASVHTVDGDVLVEALNGNLEIETEDGDIYADKLTGPSIEIDTEDGDIILVSVEANNVFVLSSDGDLEASSIKGKAVTIASSDGDIDVKRIDGGKIKIKTDDGDVDIGASGEELTVRCTDGNIRVQLFTQMAVSLDAYDGDIDLHLPVRMGAELDLRGEDIRVAGGLSVKGQVSDRRILGSINNGGPTVRAKTHDGSIALRTDA